MALANRWLMYTMTAALSLSLIGGAAAEQERPRERMAGALNTLVSMHNRGGMPALLSYDREPAYDCDNTSLGKLRVGVVAADGVKWFSDAKDLEVRNSPNGEGVEAVGTVGGAKLKVEVLPTNLGRPGPAWEGAAVFRVTSDSPVKLVMEWGGIGHVRIHGFHPAVMERREYLVKPDLVPIPASEAKCTVHGSGGTLEAQSVILKAAVSFASAGKAKTDITNGFLRFATSSPVKTAYVMAGFADTVERARELAKSDPSKQEMACRERYRLLDAAANIETPSAAINGAFRWAAINMEYAWVKPYGWIECLHHWGTLFSQQHNMAADWMGQADRSRDMLLAHAAAIYPGGQIPQLNSHGESRINFGGWNQFYVWGLQHYWEQTGDRDFLKRARPILDKVVAQTFAEHDPDGNGLLAFGQQIGNQEDYVSTPEDGASPTIAAIEMRRIQAEFARADGDSAQADEYQAAAERMAKTLRSQLWNSDLGRYEFYTDRLGTHHLDGQYHTFIWPVMYNLLDCQDGYNSMRHLADTLTAADDGRVFTSNNFPNHVWATVGCQAGGQQQPWVTFGWAKLGDGKKAVGPLEWISNLVMNTGNAGSWPEVYEDDPNYFTPPAGVFIWGVVEGLFGLSVNKPEGVVRISPCLPNDWPGAKLNLADYQLSVTQSEGHRTIVGKSKDAFEHVYRVAIPPSSEVKAVADGKPVGARIEPGVNCQYVEVKLPATTSSTLELAWSEVKTKPAAPSQVSPGEWMKVDTGSLHVTGVSDPCSVLAGSEVKDGEVRLRVRDGVASDAELYGAPGKRILTRRTVFLDVSAGDYSYLAPIDFSVVPPVTFAERPELAKTSGGWALRFRADSDVPAKIRRIEFGGRGKSISAQTGAAASIDLDAADIAAIHPGPNKLDLILEGGAVASGVFDAAPIFAESDMSALAAAMTKHVALPQNGLSDDGSFRSWRWWSAYGHQPWASLGAPLEGLDPKADLAPPSLRGLTFANPDRKVAVASWKMGSPSVTIPVKTRARALYLLMLPMLDNQDVFSPVCRVTATCRDGVVQSRVLHFPGDFDWWGSKAVLGGFATVDSDWCFSPRWEAPSSVMNVITMELGDMRLVDSVKVESIGRYPAMAVVGVTAYGGLSDEAAKSLPESVRAYAAQEARTLFVFNNNSLEGWTITGNAWGLTDGTGDPGGRVAANRYFADSLHYSEQATGTITSPPFTITGSRLTFLANGHSPKNYYALVDADTGAELMTARSPRVTGIMPKLGWDVSQLKGRSVRFKAVDADDAQAYAWIAFDEVTMEP